MTFTAEEIERIVQEVIRRLAVAGIRANPNKSDKPDKALTIESRLITLATLEGQLEGINQVIVPPRAVVTPAVKDELRDRKIELTRQAV